MSGPGRRVVSQFEFGASGGDFSKKIDGLGCIPPHMKSVMAGIIQRGPSWGIST
jgi:hypothetical protein